MISIKQLRYLDAAARHRHFGKAAQAVAVSQPALSMQIQELENSLNIQIFERLPQGVRLTADGAEIATRAARILSEINDLTDFAKQRQQPLSGTLNLGVIPTIAPYLLPPLLRHLRDTEAALKLNIRESQTRTLINQLHDGGLDVLLLALPIDLHGLAAMPIFDDRFVLVCAASQTSASSPKAELSDLNQQRLLVLEEGHCLRDQTLAFLPNQSAGKIDAFGASSLATLVELVASGMGCTLLPEIAIAQETGHRTVRVVRFSDPQPRRQIGLVWRRSATRLDDVQALGKIIAGLAPTSLD